MTGDGGARVLDLLPPEVVALVRGAAVHIVVTLRRDMSHPVWSLALTLSVAVDLVRFPDGTRRALQG